MSTDGAGGADGNTGGALGGNAGAIAGGAFGLGGVEVGGPTGMVAPFNCACAAGATKAPQNNAAIKVLLPFRFTFVANNLLWFLFIIV